MRKRVCVCASELFVAILLCVFVGWYAYMELHGNLKTRMILGLIESLEATCKLSLAFQAAATH